MEDIFLNPSEDACGRFCRFQAFSIIGSGVKTFASNLSES